MTKEKTKAPPLYIPGGITRVLVSNMRIYHMPSFRRAFASNMRWETAYHTFVWGNGERKVE